MTTIAENLSKLQTIKSDIKTSILNKGVDVNDDFTTYSAAIDSIETGGGSGGTFVVPDGISFGASKFSEIPNYLDFSKCTIMNNTFNDCENLTHIENFSVSTVNEVVNVFNSCDNLKSIGNITFENATKATLLFQNCANLETITSLHIPKATEINGIFRYCNKLTNIPYINIENATNANGLFYSCTSLTTIPQLNTKNIKDLSSFFYGCSSLISIPELDTSSCTNFSYFVNGCNSLTSIALLNCKSVSGQMNIFGYNTLNNLTYLGGFKDLKVSATSNFLDKVPNLTVESLMNVINNVYDLTANGLSGKSMKFGQTNLDKLTEEQIAVATAKGWTITA